MSINIVKPFIKWVGGKSKLSNEIIKKFPEDYNNYYEPFLGGGYMGLSLDIHKKKYFSDINSKLINCYYVIKYNSEELVEELSRDKYKNDKETFLKIRKKFNEEEKGDIKNAAMFIYLNKCCFNGLYRENNSGDFNVPFGDMKNPVICDENLIKNISKYLQNVEMFCDDYKSINPCEKDLVYLDPPYHQTFNGILKMVFARKNK